MVGKVEKRKLVVIVVVVVVLVIVVVGLKVSTAAARRRRLLLLLLLQHYYYSSHYYPGTTPVLPTCDISTSCTAAKLPSKWKEKASHGISPPQFPRLSISLKRGTMCSLLVEGKQRGGGGGERALPEEGDHVLFADARHLRT